MATVTLPKPAADSTRAPPDDHRPEAEPEAELFQLYGERDGLPLADAATGAPVTAPRARVHREGLAHAAVYGWIIDSARGRVLLQRRSAAKKIGPGQWDLSVAEHLEPGEGHRAAVVRGLSEELGLGRAAAGRATAREPSGPGRHLRVLRVPEVQVVDREWVESYVVRAEELLEEEEDGGGEKGEEGEKDGADAAWWRALKFNPNEVSAVKWVGLRELKEACRERPEEYTQWLREEGELLGWFL